MDGIPNDWEKLILTTSGRHVGTSTFTKLTGSARNELELWLLENIDRLPRICRFNENALPSDIPHLRIGQPHQLGRKTTLGIFKLIGATRLPCNSCSAGQIQSLLFMNMNNRECLMHVQPWGTQKAEDYFDSEKKTSVTNCCVDDINEEPAGKDNISDRERCRSKNKETGWLCPVALQGAPPKR